MNTASVALCRELYNLSGWKDTDYFHQFREYDDRSGGYHLVNPVLEAPLQATAYPAYDLGYLLRRLPSQTRIKKEFDASLELPEETPAHFRALYDTVDGRHFWLGADMPEDAAAKLAIELFKHGVLKPDAQ